MSIFYARGSGGTWSMETSHADRAGSASAPGCRGPHARVGHRSGHVGTRSAIICQLQHKADTDLDLLTAVIEANQEDSEFFIRKAIGWALRDYARTDSDWVRAFVQAHANLSPLSRREALKHL